MNNEAMKEVLNELFSHLEKLETQNEAILQFLKEKKRVTDKQLAPYLEQAGNASSVRWRAARVRIDHLLEPEHPEKEIKLGKRPEFHEAPSTASSAGSSEGERRESENQASERSESENQQGKRSEPPDQVAKHAELGDLLSGDSDDKDKSQADDGKARPAEAKAEKPDSATGSKEVATQPPAEQQGAEPAAQLKSAKTNNEKEAA